MLCTMLLHTAVVAHPVHKWDVASRWAEALADEFLCQGDEFAEFGLPVPPHMNRNLATAPQLAISNLDNFVIPSLQLLASLMPKVLDWSKQAVANRGLFASAVVASGAMAGGDNAPLLAGTDLSAQLSAGEGGDASSESVRRFFSIMMPEDLKMAARPRQTMLAGVEAQRGGKISEIMGQVGDEAAREAKVLTPWQRWCLFLLPFQKELALTIEGGYWQFLSFSMTILALFLDQVRDAALPISADAG